MKDRRMNVEVCECCRKLFKPVSGLKVCHTCHGELEKQYEDVKEFVRNNPELGIEGVAAACKVLESSIVRWMREERLLFSLQAEVTIPCQCCGDDIEQGRYCQSCATKLNVLYTQIKRTKTMKANRRVEVIELDLEKSKTPSGLRFQNRKSYAY